MDSPALNAVGILEYFREKTVARDVSPLAVDAIKLEVSEEVKQSI